MSEQIMQDITVINEKELKLVGIRVVCPGDQYVLEIPRASKLLDERKNEIKHVINPTKQIGAFVAGDDCPEEEDGYWVCFEVKEYEEIPQGMVVLTVPPQKYAVLRHKGPNHKIREAYGQLHNWIEENGFTRERDKWHLELFHSWEDVMNIDVELLETIE
ncbi:GyrI-like domain-containing protein [Ferdinandcohnia quinoae]|uniref:GyrI-like domain-containing protein n=1 Tax=Fredinandcohnia quinoae TaxID=2918902 RepID=A0AAW5EAJ5_9BACI|nr:GyrI-like domain-containing protein [Fredinandcohnia sp. SECRCQ15]MCH1626441.1 GyrI-like domain-containing protein [Fredinandcohnia sp. SECRCQ15]